jgi:hypothetical protein
MLFLAAQALGAPTPTVSDHLDEIVIDGPSDVVAERAPTTEQVRRASAAAVSHQALAHKAQQLGLPEGVFTAFFIVADEEHLPPELYEPKLPFSENIK